jgi:hypothetical protein
MVVPQALEQLLRRPEALAGAPRKTTTGYSQVTYFRPCGSIRSRL